MAIKERERKRKRVGERARCTVLGECCALLIAVIEGAPQGLKDRPTDGQQTTQEIHNVISRQVPKKYLHKKLFIRRQ